MPHPIPTLAGGMAAAAVLLLAVTTAVSSQGAPMIVAEAGKLTVQASDLVLQQPGDDVAPVSIAGIVAELAQARTELTDLKAEMAALKGAAGPSATLDSYANKTEMLATVDAAVAGLGNEVLGSQADAAAAVNGRVDALLQDIAGLPETQRVVAKLAADVNQVLLHTENITKCGADGSVHLGSGDCASAVPTCPAPAAPAGGTVDVSSPYIIPGVTAKYDCTAAGSFLVGGAVRTCTEANRSFSGEPPSCPICSVPHCDTCELSPTQCGLCSFGYDRSPDGSECAERKDTIVIMGGRPPGNNGHNLNECEILQPGGENWEGFLPKLPGQATQGAAGMIRGVIYVATALVRYAPVQHYWKLEPRATEWTNFAAMSEDARKNKPYPFHAVADVGASSKFFVIGNIAAEAYSPEDDGWTVLPAVPSAAWQGGTAVLPYLANGQRYGKVYCMGGVGPSGTTAAVSVLDTATNVWEEGVAMTGARKLFAAASYNGLVVVFGGIDGGNVKLDVVEVFDAAAGLWASKTAMAGPWSDFSTGPMPVLGGKAILPSSHASQFTNGLRTVPGLEYDIGSDVWGDGPVPIRRRGQYTIVTGTRAE